MTRFLIGLTLGFAVGFVVAILWRDGFFVSEPEIARDLPVRREEADAVLTKRIMDKFPAGTPEQALKEFLADQGFALGFRSRNDDRPMAMLFQNGICPKYWNVKWAANDQGLVELIEATFRNDSY